MPNIHIQLKSWYVYKSDAAMPNKWLNQKGIEVKKQRYKISNWSEYNAKLKKRGDIEVWLSQELIDNWYAEIRIYDGTGSSKYYRDETIIVCHELRQVYKLPLRQAQGFINSWGCLQTYKLIDICSINPFRRHKDVRISGRYF